MAEDPRLARIERRLDSLTAATVDLAAIGNTTNAMIGELMEWMKEPGSSEITDLIRSLVATVTDLTAAIHGVPGQVVDMLRRPPAGL